LEILKKLEDPKNKNDNSFLGEKKKDLKKENLFEKNKKNIVFLGNNNKNVICFNLNKDKNIVNKSQKIKCKICILIFDEFKKDNNYRQFKKFSKIEKNLYADNYEKLSKMASDIRDIFNEYFASFSGDIVNYPKIFGLFSHFEKIYKEYENKKFINETKNILEIKKKMNKLQKIMKISKFKVGQNPNINGENRLMKFDENASLYTYEINREKRISNKFKLDLLNNIKTLSIQQIREMVKLLQDINNEINLDKISFFELDINKLSNNKIKDLDRYVKRCIIDNKSKGLREISFKFDKNINNISNDINDNEFVNDNKNFLLSKKKVRNFFEDEINKKNFKTNRIFIENTSDIDYKGYLLQNPCTKPETPISHLNKINTIKYKRANSLADSEVESEESSDEESYSDLEIGKFKI